MPRRRPATGRRLEPASPTRRPRIAPSVVERRDHSVAASAVILVLAALATAGGLAHFRSVWLELPAAKWRTRQDGLNRAYSEMLAELSGEARLGQQLAAGATDFTAGLRDPQRLARVGVRADEILAEEPVAALAGLQIAAARLARLEHDGAPVETRWPLVKPDLAGLETAAFAHHLAAWRDAATAMYTRLGLGPGTARRMAESWTAAAHTPFLQYSTRQLGRLAHERRDAGDAPAAETCERIRQRLLRDWLLEPGPPVLRLLAAELLTQVPELGLTDAPESTTSAPMSTSAAAEQRVPPEVAAAARAWRQAVRSKMESWPAAVPLLAVYGADPEPRPHEQRALLISLALGLGLLGAATGAAFLAILGLASAFAAARRPDLGRREVVVAAAIAAVILAAALAWPLLWPSALHHEFRRFDPQPGETHLPWHPFILGGAGVLLLAGGSFVKKSRSAALSADGHKRASLAGGVLARLTRLAGLALVTWALFAVALLATSLHAARAREQYESSVATALRTAELDPTGAPAVAAHLAVVQAWQP